MIMMFTGHRNSVRNAELDQVGLKNCISSLCPNKYEFVIGGCPGYDTLVLSTLIDLGVSYNAITLYVPFVGFEKYADRNDIEGTRTAQILNLRVKQIPVERKASFAQMCYARNKTMVDMADVCITNLFQGSGGTYNTVQMALKKGMPVFRTHENDWRLYHGKNQR